LVLYEIILVYLTIYQCCRNCAGTVKSKLTTRSVKAFEPRSKYYKVWDTELSGFFLRVMPSSVKSFCVYYRHAGLGKEYTIGKYGKVTVDQARTEAKVKLGELAKGHDIQANKKLADTRSKARKHKALGKFIENKYKSWVLAERKSGEETLKKLNLAFPHLMKHHMEEITSWEIQKWRTGKIKSGLKPATLNRQLMALKAVLSKALEWGVIDKHPLTNVKPLKIDSKGKIRYLTDDEEKRLRKTLDARECRIKRDRQSGNEWRSARNKKLLEDISNHTFADYLKPLIVIAMNTGMRRGELFDLTWTNVDLKKRNITVEGTTSKSGSTRHIPLNDEALGTLIAWRNQTNNRTFVFLNPNTGKRFDNIQTAWDNLRASSKIKDFRFHDLRHHFASKLVMAGVDLNTVRELLGHSELSMTLRYAHLAPEHKAAAVAMLNKI